MIGVSDGISWFLYAIARLQKKLWLSAIKRSTIDRTSVAEAGCQIVDSQMGRHSFCGYGCIILNSEIGAFCSIADQVYIGGSHHPIHFVSTSPVFLSHRDSVRAKFSRHEYGQMLRTVIGNDVWIGYGAKIRAGVTIGHGAVVGMGSVVARDVPPYTIVAGNPAREIRKRFAPEICMGLLKTEWWAFSDEKLKEAAQLFQDPEKFLRDTERL